MHDTTITISEQHSVLTQEEINLIINSTSNSDPMKGIVLLWETILGKPLAEMEGMINPRSYTISKEQASEIFEGMIKMVDADLRAGLTMQWVNVAPGVPSE